MPPSHRTYDKSQCVRSLSQSLSTTPSPSGSPFESIRPAELGAVKNCKAGPKGQHGMKRAQDMYRRPPRASLAQAIIEDVFASADIRLGGGERPWDIRVHDERFFRRILTGGTLAFGESYMDGWWDCDALDEMCCRAIRARLEERVPLNFQTALAFVTFASFQSSEPQSCRGCRQTSLRCRQRFF